MQVNKDGIGILAGAAIIISTLLTAQLVNNKITTGLAMTTGIGLVYFSAKPKS